MAETVYTKSELIAVLKDFGREFRIPTIYLFGSYARGEATPESDVDIVIDSRNIHGLLEFERARQYLSDRLGKPVDMISLCAIEDEKDFPYRKASACRKRPPFGGLFLVLREKMRYNGVG